MLLKEVQTEQLERRHRLAQDENMALSRVEKTV
jgi:hypothetical protein